MPTLTPNGTKACPICGRTFRNLKSHLTKSHPNTKDGRQQAPIGSPVVQRNFVEHAEVLIRLRKSTPILRRITKGARTQAAEVLSGIIHRVTSVNDPEAWLDLFSFPLVALQLPRKSDKVKNLTTWVKSNIERWRQQGRSALPASVAEARQPVLAPEAQGAKRVEAKVAEGNVHGAVRLLISDDVLALPDHSALTSLTSKHPPHPTPATFPEAPMPAPALAPVAAQEVDAAVRSFNQGSAGGMDGPLTGALRDLLLDQSVAHRDTLLDAIAELVDVLFQGAVPPEVCPIFFGATLIALNKKDGRVRPIAIGNVWRRLAAKIVCRRMRPLLVDTSPLISWESPYRAGRK